MKCASCGQFGHGDASCTTGYRPRSGQDNGGIRSLADIKDRCRVDDITGCWNWAQSLSSGTKGSQVPVAWWPHESRVVSVPRVAYFYGSGVLAKPRALVWRTCNNGLCCNPSHLRMGTRAQWGVWLKSHGTRKDKQSTASRRAARVASGRTTLTMELAQWARESGQTGVDVAHAIGTSPTQISRARLGRAWAPLKSGASVFSWRPA